MSEPQPKLWEPERPPEDSPTQTLFTPLRNPRSARQTQHPEGGDTGSQCPGSPNFQKVCTVCLIRGTGYLVINSVTPPSKETLPAPLDSLIRPCPPPSVRRRVVLSGIRRMERKEAFGLQSASYAIPGNPWKPGVVGTFSS